MDAGALYRLFASTVVPEEHVRTPAEEELKKAELAPGFMTAVLQILASNEADDMVRQAAAIFFKNRCSRGWDPAKKERMISDQDKAYVRQHILGAIVHLPPKIRVQLVACLGAMLGADARTNSWPSYLSETMALAQSSDEASVNAGVVAVHEYVRVFQWGTEEKRQALVPIIQDALPTLQRIATAAATSNTQEAGQLVKTILKTYHATIRLGLSPIQQNSASLVPWGTLFVQIVEKPLPLDMPGMPEDPAEREKHPWWKAKKWAYSCLNFLFERYGRKPELAYKSFSATFMEHFACNILTSYLKQVEAIVGGAWVSGRVVKRIANYLQACVKPKSTWHIMKPHLEVIIMHFIFPRLCFSDEDQESWDDDPVEYVRKRVDNPVEEFRSPVQAVQDLLFDIAKLRSTQTFIPIVTLINGIITRHQEAPVEQRNPREKDGALTMMSTVAALALDKKSPILGHLETFISANVLPELASPHGFLRARACETLVAYEELSIQDPSVLLFAFQGVAACLRDPELPVRVTAALALKVCMRSEVVHEAMKPHVQDIIRTLMVLTDEVDMDTLPEVMETVVSDFSDLLSPFAADLATSLAQTLSRLIEEVSQETDDPDLNELLEEKTLTTQGVMRTLCTLVMAMEASPQIISQLEIIAAPVLAMCLERGLLDFFEDVFEIIETSTFCSKTISPTMWQLWPSIYSAFKGDACDYIDEMTNSLENFICYGSATFAQSSDHQAQIFDIIKTILCQENRARLSNTNRTRACDLVEAVLLNLEGHVDVMIPQFLDLVLPYLQPPAPGEKVTKPALRVRYLEIVVNAIRYNPSGTLALLDQRNATAVFFQLWFKDLPEFRRVHDKKLCVLALSAILELPMDQFPAASLHGTEGWMQILNGILTVFETYPVALRTREKEMSALDEEDDEEAEDDDEDQLLKDSTDDVDVLDNEDEYMELLARKAAEANPATTDAHGTGQYFSDDESDDDDDPWEEDELAEDPFFETPLDKVDAYASFEATVKNLLARPDTAGIMGQLGEQQQIFMQGLWQQGRVEQEKERVRQAKIQAGEAKAAPSLL
ncbi:hypothetical protein HKX48_003183 [Thoreauomyces humboldtii]|nr:hypothetical protein HKX48_003183 [Thoreauomyces humboldtii]